MGVKQKDLDMKHLCTQCFVTFVHVAIGQKWSAPQNGATCQNLFYVCSKNLPVGG